MSAYAISSFGSYLSPIIGSSNKDNNIKEPKSELNPKDAEEFLPEEKTAVRIKVKSAIIDAGVLVSPSNSKFNMNQNYFSVPDDSVRFKLSIKFNGRKYTATRSFAKFVKLRKDLVNELSCCGGMRSKDRRCMDNEEKQRRCLKAETTLPKLPERISDQVDGSCHFMLPRMSSGYKMAKAAASLSFNMGSGSLTGFTKLQSLLLCYYSPLIECWLRNVMNIMDVDTSPCLNNFLWEPLRDSGDIPSLCSSNNSSKGSRPSLSRKTSSSSLSLSSINEDNVDMAADNE